MAALHTAPQVPESARFRRERQAVVEEYWQAGLTDSADVIARGEVNRVCELDRDLLGTGWTLLELRSRARRRSTLVCHTAVCDGEGTMISLTRNRHGYQEFVACAGVRIDSAEAALAALHLALVSARDMRRFRAFVHSPEDLHLARRRDWQDVVRVARTAAGGVIEPATVLSARDRYAVTVCFQEDDTVQRWQGTIARDGTPAGEVTLLTRGLPVDFHG